MSDKRNLLISWSMPFVILLLIDLVIGTVVVGFDYRPNGGILARYFSYGVSTLEKLKILVSDTNENSANIAKAGWNEKLPVRQPAIDKNCSYKVTFYGMSFTNRIASRIRQQDPCLAVRQIAGPGAPLSHSYFSFERFYQQDDSDVIVLGILASSLPKLLTTSHLTASFEYPGAHMYPRYQIGQDGALKSSGVLVQNLYEFRELIINKNGLLKLTDYLRKYDKFYNHIVFSYDWADYSITLRMLRRAYAQKSQRRQIRSIYSDGKFNNNSNLKLVALALVKNFAKKTKAQGKMPIILILNDRGYASSLDDVFIPDLKEHDIAHLTSSDVLDSTDLSNFVSDGHFTPLNDSKISNAVLTLIENKVVTGEIIWSPGLKKSDTVVD